MSVALIGALNLLLIHLELLDASKWLTALATAIVLTHSRSKQGAHGFILKDLKRELQIIKNEISGSRLYQVGLLLVVILAVTAVGPINHPDAADYHAGYPYHFFLRGHHFIDGGLHQGLLGLGDFAHISTYQDGTSWLIRFIQYLPIPLIYCVAVRRRANGLCLLALLTTPAWMQVLTIGKPLFFSDACVAVCYICYRDRRSANNRSYLISACILSVGYKLSSLLFCAPLIVHVLLFHRKEFWTESKVKRILPIAVSLALVGVIIAERIYSTGNPVYPFLTSVFNPNNAQVQEFESMLRGYRRGLQPLLGLFAPLSLGEMGLTLGPGVTLLGIMRLLVLSRSTRHDKETSMVCAAQLLLLTFFGQLRCDYFLGTFIILLILPKTALYLGILSSNIASRTAVAASITIQSVIFVPLIMVSNYQTMGYLINYRTAMNSTAYGFSLESIHQKYGRRRMVNLAERNTRLYYRNYVDADLFLRCNSSPHSAAVLGPMKATSGESSANRFRHCIEALKIELIISRPKQLDSVKGLNCKQEPISSAARNPFNSREAYVDVCGITKADGK